METFKYIAFLSLLLVSAQSSALNLTGINQPIEQGLYDSRSCNDLYMQALTLEKESFGYKAGNNRTQVASLISTVFTPAIYYFGFSAFQNYKDGVRSKVAFNEIEAIRFRMAEKRCFIK